MSTINLASEITNLEGKPLMEAGAPVKLAAIACNVLLAVYPDEPNLSGNDKVKRFALAMKIHESCEKDLELTAEDISLLKKLIAKAYSPLVVGRAYELLEPSSAPKPAVSLVK